MEIPHIIHYCWFGCGSKPREMVECISSWKKYFPDWTIMEWNEKTTDMDQLCTYAKEAYAVGKYAFVSDYVRIKVLVELGGIYFDTDVQVVRDCRCLFEKRDIVLGFQSDRDLLTAMIAAIPGHPMLREFLDIYQVRRFKMAEGEYDYSAINYHFNKLAKKYGVDLEQNTFQEISDKFVVYPSEYFCAFDLQKWHEIPTEKTCAIHHMASSWCSFRVRMKAAIIKRIVRFFGAKTYDKIYMFYRKGKK
ncbi:MAG: glycosyl transferase [Eubacterium sp.]|nr:glycosyl transferase [Eubacterium sp.]